MRLSEVAETSIRTRGGNISNRLKAAFTALRIALPKPMHGIEPAAAAEVHSVIDWGRLEAQYRRNPAFVDRLARMTLHTRGGTPAELHRAASACAQGDFGQAVFLAHALKGIAGNLKAADLLNRAAQAEEAARRQLPDAARLALELAVALEAVLAELAARVQAADKEPDPT